MRKWLLQKQTPAAKEMLLDVYNMLDKDGDQKYAYARAHTRTRARALLPMPLFRRPLPTTHGPTPTSIYGHSAMHACMFTVCAVWFSRVVCFTASTG